MFTTTHESDMSSTRLENIEGFWWKYFFSWWSVGSVYATIAFFVDVNGSPRSASILFAFTRCPITVSDCHSVVFKRCWTNSSNQPVGFFNCDDEQENIPTTVFSSLLEWHTKSIESFIIYRLIRGSTGSLVSSLKFHSDSILFYISERGDEASNLRQRKCTIFERNMDTLPVNDRWCLVRISHHVIDLSSFAFDSVVSVGTCEISSGSSSSTQALWLSRRDHRLGWNRQRTRSMDSRTSPRTSSQSIRNDHSLFQQRTFLFRNIRDNRTMLFYWTQEIDKRIRHTYHKNT